MTENEIEKYRLQGSLLDFVQVFYKLRTGRLFELSQPVGRESHYLTVMRELVNLFELKTKRLIINIPPGHGKSTMLQYFVAWALSQYPDSQFIYISYSKGLAEQHTAEIKQIMELPHYKKIFDVHLSDESSAKGHFKTTAGGCVMAAGSDGGITGFNAGLPNLDRFSGMVIIDDAHKPDEVHSDTMRLHVINNYNRTIKPRPRGPNVPIAFIGQRLHEDDLAAYLINGNDGYQWNKVILKSIDGAGNALCPNINSLEMLRIEQDKNPYVFSSQYQQDPQPAGGGIFKPEWFPLLDQEPEILGTFITVDTAETDKNYNDATAFSFFGVYKIKNSFVETDTYGLHWIDCYEIRVEPKDLEFEFNQFYLACMNYRVKPKCVAIEKKSTGTTLFSVLNSYQGMNVIDITRTKASGNKTSRFLEMQPYISSKRVSLPKYGAHVSMCIDHCRKITANNSHRFDDICDTLYDAVRLALIDQYVINRFVKQSSDSLVAKKVMAGFNNIMQAKENRYGRSFR